MQYMHRLALLLVTAAFPSLFCTGKVRQQDANPADRIYYYSAPQPTDGMDAVISSSRGTIRIGSDVFAFKECDDRTAVVCMKSRYFNLWIPKDGMHNSWTDGNASFSYLARKTTFRRSKNVAVVVSSQNGGLFLFFVDEKSGLIGWTRVSTLSGISESYLERSI